MKFLHHNSTQQPRRQRLVGTTQAPVYSYYARRSQEQSILGRQAFRDVVNREVASVKQFNIKRLKIVLGLVVALIGLVELLWVSPQPKIIPLTTDKTVFLHSESTYQQAAVQLLKSSILNQTKLTIRDTEISTILKRRFPELGVVYISLPFFGHQPIIYIAPTDARLRLKSQSGLVYIIDSSGRAIAEMTGGSDNNSDASLPIVYDQSGTPVILGRPLLSSDTVSFIRTIAFQVGQKHLQVDKFVLPNGVSELDLYIAGQPYYVKFNLEDDSALQQVGTFLAVRHHLEGKGKTPSQYIDVRLVGRAYYK